jgi:hypothetical protein
VGVDPVLTYPSQFEEGAGTPNQSLISDECEGYDSESDGDNDDDDDEDMDQGLEGGQYLL